MGEDRFKVALKLGIFGALLLFGLLHFVHTSGIQTEIDDIIVDQDYRWIAVVAFFTTFTLVWFFKPGVSTEESKDSVFNVLLITLMGWGSAFTGIERSFRGLEFAVENNLPIPIGTAAGLVWGSALGAFWILIAALVVFWVIQGSYWVFKKFCNWLLS